MATVEDVSNTALGLRVEGRAVFAERLPASLDRLDEREWGRLWGKEAARRLASHHNGMGVGGACNQRQQCLKCPVASAR